MNVSKGTITRAILLALALINQILQSSGHQVIPVDNAAVADAISWLFTFGTAIAGFWKNNSFSVSALFGDRHMKIYKALSTLAKTGVLTTADADAIMTAITNASQSVLVTDIKATLLDKTKTGAEKAEDVAKEVGEAILNTVDYDEAKSGSAETIAGNDTSKTV